MPFSLRPWSPLCNGEMQRRMIPSCACLVIRVHPCSSLLGAIPTPNWCGLMQVICCAIRTGHATMVCGRLFVGSADGMP
jgi:hypothetical protein